MSVLITGGCGFIGGHLAHLLAQSTDAPIAILDKMGYASNNDIWRAAEAAGRIRVFQADLQDGRRVREIIADIQPQTVFHLAAESHVDASIDGPATFVANNVVGSTHLLEALRAQWGDAAPDGDPRRRLIHVSTDEAFGALGPTGAFDEASPYDPNSPYSASKAASDLLALAWGRTYGLPVVVTNGANTYGPFQHPEKLIPLSILRALRGQPIQVYGDGGNVRDWVHVEDHARALIAVADLPQPGERYVIGGGGGERSNIAVVRALCAALDKIAPRADGRRYAEQIAFVRDRPAHDWRYALNSKKLTAETGWRPDTAFEDGLAQTVAWYCDQRAWWEAIVSMNVSGGRIGLGESGAA